MNLQTALKINSIQVIFLPTSASTEYTLEHLRRELNQMRFHLLAPLLDVLRVFDYFELSRFDLVVLSLLVTQLASFFLQLPLLYFLRLPLFDLLLQLLHFVRPFLLFLPTKFAASGHVILGR